MNICIKQRILFCKCLHMDKLAEVFYVKAHSAITKLKSPIKGKYLVYFIKHYTKLSIKFFKKHSTRNKLFKNTKSFFSVSSLVGH